jgi:uncharacterized protein HemY
MKASKYTASQHMERAELAMQKQDIDTARECLHEAAELSPQVGELTFVVACVWELQHADGLQVIQRLGCQADIWGSA